MALLEAVFTLFEARENRVNLNLFFAFSHVYWKLTLARPPFVNANLKSNKTLCSIFLHLNRECFHRLQCLCSEERDIGRKSEKPGRDKDKSIVVIKIGLAR